MLFVGSFFIYLLSLCSSIKLKYYSLNFLSILVEIITKIFMNVIICLE
ncbi:hypothetical protein A5866_000202 [Enterococcus sp. 12C11_DIV0727]|uniref:Uncharacterized protein n=1 Tax=Candidatus Enterococcus lemimoniae TaxID=1834167 RepID=A0ABZ2T2Q3_9ENTE|nr:hypothetical protein A5866_001831 [Enterococcus sp. 12C11_DIV0727]